MKPLAIALAAVGILPMAYCAFNETGQRKGLETLCGAARPGSPLKAILDEAAKTSDFRIRTGGPAGKSDMEWFDREYLRLGKYLQEAKKISGDYSVVFAKPGMGYYACIVVHKDGTVQQAWFEDRSS